MRHESSVTSISWIPSEAISGAMRLPMDIGMGHYDTAPPDRIGNATLDELRDEDRLRFANRLAAWIEVEDGRIVDAGYAGRAVVGSTTAKVGLGSITFPGLAYPVIQNEPLIADGKARFVQTAGGRTGAPLPRRTSHPPYVRISGPTAWTTLALEIAVDGSARFEVAGASPFPRHWIYDAAGELAAKSGVIDWATWTKEHDHTRSPWHDVDVEALVADVESAVERSASHGLMSTKPDIRKLAAGATLTHQGEPGDELYLVLDGMFHVSVDDEVVAEIGPGAIVGERAILEGGVRTSTVTAVTPSKVAAAGRDAIDEATLAEIAVGHDRETAS
jgi:hypothetical protein